MRRCFFILYLLLTSVSVYSQSKNCEFCGTWRWEKNDMRHDFSVEISLKDGFLIGKHCYVLDSGNKMDCATGSKDYSFKIENPTNDTVTVNLKSFYSGKFGRIHLKVKEGRLIWNLIRPPKGEYYFPKQAFLVHDKK